MEKWLPVVGYEGKYEVSNLGRVRGVDRYVPSARGALRPVRGVDIKQSVYKGYYRVMLKSSGAKFIPVHRLVAMAFVNGYFDGACVNHINGDKADNRPGNLEWVTSKENTQHAIRGLGKRRDGVHSGMAKLTEADVSEIREVYAAEMAIPSRRGERKRPRTGVMAPYFKKFSRSLVNRVVNQSTYKEMQS